MKHWIEAIVARLRVALTRARDPFAGITTPDAARSLEELRARGRRC